MVYISRRKISREVSSMELKWAVRLIQKEAKPPAYIVGIEDCETGIIDQICSCEYEHEAELIRNALEAHMVPNDFYRE
jgi:hypothetical protein